MALYGLFYGGPSYSHFMEDEDVEVFTSIERAKLQLIDRFNGRGWVDYATPGEDGKGGFTIFPAVTEDAHILILDIVRGRGKKGYNPGAHGDPIGDLTLRMAKRLGHPYGVRYERF